MYAVDRTWFIQSDVTILDFNDFLNRPEPKGHNWSFDVQSDYKLSGIKCFRSIVREKKYLLISVKSVENSFRVLRFYYISLDRGQWLKCHDIIGPRDMMLENDDTRISVTIEILKDM